MGIASIRSEIMLYATTNILEGYKIKEYLGVIAGEAIMGANVFRDITAGIRDIVGGRSGAYEDKLRQAKELAMEDMTVKAEELGANAIIGIDLDYETIRGSMLMVSVSGTAVVVQK
jgi:uncharacterized protein YbjQ (UPF0145 family)